MRDLSNSSGEPIDLDSQVASEPGVEVLAPDKTVCEPPGDCRNCPRQENCSRYEEPDDDEGEDEENEEEENDDSEDEAEEEEENDDDDDLEDEYDPKNTWTRMRSIAASSEPCASANSSAKLALPSKPNRAIPTDQRKWRDL